MAPQKHRLSNLPEAEHRTKMPRQPQNEDTPQDCFAIEVKLRSTSKAERNDPKPPQYYQDSDQDLIKDFNDFCQNNLKGKEPSDSAPPADSAGGSGAKLSEVADLDM
jgi:hypothetical protein